MVGTPGPSPRQLEFALDEDRSRLEFRAKAFCLVWVTGSLRARSGVITVVEDSLQAEGVADARSVSTGLGLRDWHLRHRHYLSSAEHPDVRLEVSDVRLGPGSANAQLTVRGRTVDVPLTIESLDLGSGELRLLATASFDRRSLGMLPPLAGVSRLVHIMLDLVAMQRSSELGS